jgi:collagenase-like PrtC family protease
MSNMTTWTPEHLASLEAAIATGALEVYYGDKKVKYRSLQEMLTTRDIIKNALAASTPGKGFGRDRRFSSFNNGL